MVDIVTPAVRSRMMGSILGRDTKPEMRVRRYLHAVGLRFRLHDRDRPGKPDLTFPGRRIAVFVHGCFWHRHQGCPFATTPTTRPDFWQTKFNKNKARDAAVAEQLIDMGWRVLTIWECQTKDDVELDRLAWAVLIPYADE